MKTTQPTSLRALVCLVASALALALSVTGVAQAANHALIMTIDYAGTPNQLPGIDRDGEIAIKIAEGMGVPRANIKWIKNRELGLSGMVAALTDLMQNRITDGDKVFLYYSGHGFQSVGTGSKCTESLVAADGKLFEDDKLQQALESLSTKASQVVMFNDSCFSGGAATKEVTRSMDDSVAKVYKDTKAMSSSDADYACGAPTNKDFGSRTLGVVARQRSAQTLYVAASADHEVSRASSNGSWATQAWAACLGGRDADSDRNGMVDGAELRRCSQAFIDSRFSKKQTITLIGNEALPMSFLGGAGVAPTAVTNFGGALETVRAASDGNIRVDINLAKSRLTINKDLLDFSVANDRDGYLYLLHVASDGKFYVLFPNKVDSNNFVKAGTQRFPRPDWGIQAQGPAGTSYVMAYLSTTPKDFSKGLETEGPFTTGEANTDTSRKLGVVALGGRFGASRVAAIQEVK